MSQKAKVLSMLAILIGSAIPFTDPGSTLILVFAVGFSTFVSICLLVSSIFSGKKALKWSVVLIIPLVTAFVTSGSIRYIRHNKALEIITSLEGYKKVYGKYPKDVFQTSRVEIKGLTYWADTSQQQYRVAYLMDAFNSEYFESETPEWKTAGWND